MGRDIKLLIERKVTSGWEIPLDLQSVFPVAAIRQFWAGEPEQSDVLRVLEIEWWPIRRPVTDLFVGRLAPLDMVPGIPPDATTETSRYFMQNLEPDDPFLAWIECQNLMLADWRASNVLLTSKWPAWIARLTQHGRMCRKHLERDLAAIPNPQSVSDELISLLEGGRLAADPIDRVSTGSKQHAAQELMVDVTWEEPIADFANWLMPTMDALQSIDIEEYRIIVG